jgi:hypothetical protein
MAELAGFIVLLSAKFLLGWYLFMNYQQFDLQSGDSIRVGGYLVTLLEVDNGEVVFQIEDTDDNSTEEPVAVSDIQDCEPVLV